VSTQRVAFFLGALGGGGAERVTLDLAYGFHAAGHPVDVVVAHATGQLRDHVPAGVRFVPLGVRRTALGIPRLRTYLQRAEPAVLIGAMAHANSIGLVSTALARTRTKVIVVEHGILSVEAQNATAMRGKVLPWAARLTYPHAHAIVAVSEGVADDLARLTRVQRSSIRVIRNAVRYDAIERLAAMPPQHAWLCDGTVPVVVGAGRLTRQKDFATLLRAVARLRRERAVRLIILGEGPERGALVTLARKLGIEQDVHLAGFLANPYQAIGRASAFALSSRSAEGFPTVLLEALALGTPVVATDCPSGPREILQAASLGALIPMQDPDALASALETAIGCGRLSPYRPREHELGFVVAAYSAAGGLGV
jgi:glycosyltransferase involved in cell wall biosynthesis